MKEEKRMQIQSQLRIKDNFQFLFFENYVISVIPKINQLQFYN